MHKRPHHQRVAEHYKTRYKTPTGRRKIASDFSAQRRDGRFPIARSNFLLKFMLLAAPTNAGQALCGFGDHRVTTVTAP